MLSDPETVDPESALRYTYCIIDPASFPTNVTLNLMSLCSSKFLQRTHTTASTLQNPEALLTYELRHSPSSQRAHFMPEATFITKPTPQSLSKR